MHFKRSPITTPSESISQQTCVKRKTRREKSKPTASSSDGKGLERDGKQKGTSDEQRVTWTARDTSPPPAGIAPVASSLVVTALCLLSYWNSCYGDFVFDDLEAVLHNGDVKPETPFWDLFSHDFWGNPLTAVESHKSYRPITVLSFRLNHYLAGGLHPWSFHVLNVVLHCAASVLVLPVSAALMATAGGGAGEGLGRASRWRTPQTSLLCAVLFAVHPVHTENVAGVVGRADVLCAIFFFLSFLAYVCACSRDSSAIVCPCLLACSMLLCTVSLLCKEQGVTVIGLCSLYDIAINSCLDPVPACLAVHASVKQHGVLAAMRDVLQSPDRRWLRWLALRQITLVLSAAVLVWMRLTVIGYAAPTFQPHDNPASFADSVWIRIINYSYVYSLNAWLLLCPWYLCFDWSMGCVPLIQMPLDVRILAPIMLCAVLTHLMFLCLSDHYEKRVLLMALAMLILPFLPASNIFFTVGFVVAERTLYLPSLGYCLLVVIGTKNIATQKPELKRVIQGILLAVIACHVMRCNHRNIDWRTEESLYRAGLRVCPLNAKVHYNIGKCVADQGDSQGAITAYREAIRLHPEYNQALNNLGNLLKELNQTAEAEALLTQAVSLQPKFAAAWMNLGIVQTALHKYAEAEQSYRTALKHRRNYPDCYFNLGNLYVEAGKPGQALSAWLQASSLLHSHLQAWTNALLLLDKLADSSLFTMSPADSMAVMWHAHCS